MARFFLNEVNAAANRTRPVIWSLVGLALLTQLSCSFRTPAPQTPVVNNQAEFVSKSFFYPKGQSSATTDSMQKFAASWAAINEQGQWGKIALMHGVPQITHLNIMWRITEHVLLGYRVNPSFSKETNNDNEVALIEIPILRHYYYEAEKDSYQRDTNRYIKNESRDAWMFRPYMDLDFTKLKINSSNFSVLWGNPEILTVGDFEWDPVKQFLGFTIEAKDDCSKYDGYCTEGTANARFRFNFMAFDGSPTFKPTPYNKKTAQLINVLHVLGRQIDGTTEVDYAGHWDLSDVKNKPITFYTYGVEPGSEHMQIIQDCVNEWNKAFVAANVVPGRNGRGQTQHQAHRLPV